MSVGLGQPMDTVSILTSVNYSKHNDLNDIQITLYIRHDVNAILSCIVLVNHWICDRQGYTLVVSCLIVSENQG